MNSLQQKEFELLSIFVAICDQLQLTYYLVCGSALGAAKYQGFIPWDDDIDVALPRPDYEAFMVDAQRMLPKHVFLQNYKTDPAYPHISSKLRDSSTTYIQRSERRLPINQGIFIDVFPLDGYPCERSRQITFEIKKQLYIRELNSAAEHEAFSRKVLYFPFRLVGCPRRTQRIASAYDRMIRSYAPDASHVWCNHGNWQGKLEYARREQYGAGIFAKFEELEVRIPELYDEYLTQKYGDWRADLPEEQQVGHHYYDICDTERPYTDYV